MKEFCVERLSTGLEVVIGQVDKSDVFSLQVVIWSGSIDEKSNEYGAAHFVEHMLFKGSKSASGKPLRMGEFASLVESLGGDVNAYTTFDRTVLYATAPSKAWNQFLEAFADVALLCEFDASEFEKERKVIVEEQKRGLDDPGAVVGQKVFDIVFDGSAVSRPIIGTIESLQQMTLKDVQGFYESHYIPQNMTVVLAGDVPQKESLAKIEKTFSEAWAQSRSGRINSSNESNSEIKNHKEQDIGAGKGRVRPMLSRLSKGTTAVVSGAYNQTRIEMAFLGPNVSSEDSIYLDMASHILGGHDLSRLQLKLRDELGLVTSISSSTYAASFGGLFEVSITAEIDNLKSAVEETCKVIGRFMTDKGPAESEIARTRISFESSKVHQLETVNGIARNILSSLQTELGLGFDTFYDELVSKTTAADIQKSSKRYLNPSSLSLVLIKGDQDKFDIDSLLTSAKKTLTEAQKSPNSKELKNLGAVKKDSSRAKSSIEEISELEFGGSNRLIYRKAKSAKSMSLIAMKIAGLRKESSNSRGIHAAVASLLAQETNHSKYEKFLGSIDDLGMSLHGFSGKDSFGLEVYAIKSQWQKSLGLFVEAFAESKFSTKRLGLYVDEALSDIKNSMDSVSHVCMRRLSSQVFGDHPYAHPLVGTPTSLQVLNAKGLTSRFDAMKSSGEWLFVGSGPAEPSEVAKTLRALKQGPRKKQTKPLFEKESRVSDQEKSNDPILNKKLELDAKEQVHIALGWRGLTWKDKDRYALDVLSSLLGGHGGRLFMRIREELGLAYSVGTILNHGVDPGFFGVYMATSKNNQAQAMDELKLSLSIERLSSISDQEIELTKSHIAGNYQIGQQRLSAQCMTMGLMELYGVGLDELRQYPLKIQKVKKNDVLRVATRLLSLAPKEVSC